MNLSDAKKIRDKHKNLIGTFRPKLKNTKVIDVVVMPIDNQNFFISEYANERLNISNDELIKNFPSTEYIAAFILDIGLGFDVSKFYYEEISE